MQFVFSHTHTYTKLILKNPKSSLGILKKNDFYSVFLTKKPKIRKSKNIRHFKKCDSLALDAFKFSEKSILSVRWSL